MSRRDNTCKLCGQPFVGSLIYCNACLDFVRTLGEYLDGNDQRRHGLTKTNKKLAEVLWKVRSGIYDLPIDKDSII